MKLSNDLLRLVKRCLVANMSRDESILLFIGQVRGHDPGLNLVRNFDHQSERVMHRPASIGFFQKEMIAADSSQLTH